MITESKADGKRVFLLKNDNLSCMLRIASGQVELLHFGMPVSEKDSDAMTYTSGPGWGTSSMYNSVCLDTIPLAYSCSGTGDFRESPIEILLDGNSIIPAFTFKDAVIHEGIVPNSGRMPQAHGECDTLEIIMRSYWCNLRLYFSLFETAMTRRAVLESTFERPLEITKFMSQLSDLKGSYEMTTLDGGWISETHAHSVPVSYSKVVNESLTGFSSHRHNPGFVLSDGDNVYGFNLIYSGNHYASAQMSNQNLARVVQGINPDNFSFELAPGEQFETPEAVMTFSDRGINGMRANMHRFVNECIVPKYWSYRERPVLYNDWEGCMFDFTESKLLGLARKAKSLGCELFVLDDGWFGSRNSDQAGLGDYDVNLKKLPNGLKGLSEKVHAMGMQFGLWFEPEAVNPDSNLYRTHPDWAIHVTDPDTVGRNELLLDLRRAEVRDYIVENVGTIIDECSVNYVKWDMNRHSPLIGYAAHEYILGIYDVLHRIFDSRPEILLESCASGGNRFDLGMLCFSPQAWASDNTDPIERLDIQGGLSLLYPQSVMGSHISASPHLQTLRSTPMSTRANVSFFGIFGLELDLNHLSSVDMSELKDTIAFYKKHRSTFQFGRFCALRAEPDAVSWQVSLDEETIVGIFHRMVHAAQGYEWLRANGLEPFRVYTVESRPQLLRVSQFASMVKYIVPVDPAPDGLLVRTAGKFYKMEDASYKTTCTGSALQTGLPLNIKFSGTGYDKDLRNQGDFGSNVYVIARKTR